MKKTIVVGLLLWSQMSLAVAHPGRRTWANIHAKELCFVAKEGRPFRIKDAVDNGHEHYFSVTDIKKEDLKLDIVEVDDYDGHSLCKIEVNDGKIASVERTASVTTTK